MNSLITLMKILLVGTLVMTYVYYSKSTGKWLFSFIKDSFIFLIKLPFMIIRIVYSLIERRIQRGKS